MDKGNRIAILSCAGELPKRLRRAALAQGLDFRVIAVKGICDPDLEALSDASYPMGHFAAALDYMHKNHITHIVMAGHLVRPSLLDMRFDFKTLNLVRQHRDVLLGGDDAVLSRISRFYESQGFIVLGPSDLDKALLIQEGALAGPKLTKAQESDIQDGIRVFNIIAKADIGQSFVIHQGSVLVVEAREGTDQMLQRITQLRLDKRVRGRGNFGMMLKYAKPNQDIRLDTPTIGLQTVKMVHQAKLSAIVIAAGQVMVLQYDEVVKYCNTHKITFVSRQF